MLWHSCARHETERFVCLLSAASQPAARGRDLAHRSSPPASREDLKCKTPIPALFPPSDFQNNVQVKVIRSPADLIRLIEELKGGTKKVGPSSRARVGRTCLPAVSIRERSEPGTTWAQ